MSIRLWRKLCRQPRQQHPDEARSEKPHRGDGGGVAKLSHRRESPLRDVMPGRSGSVGLALNSPVATAMVAVFQTINMWMIHLDVV